MKNPPHILPGLAALAAASLLAWSAGPAAAQVSAPIDTMVFSGLQWTNVGPNRGGRSTGVAGSDARPLEYWFGAAGGGLWKTVDGGHTWKPVSDHKIDAASVGAIAVCEANPDIVYIGTGETQLRGNIQAGTGLYKTTDAGKTFESVGLRDARNFSRVRVHPTNCDIAYAGAFGHYGEPNEERGLYKTTDGGRTWERILYRDDKTGAVDISIDVTNPDVIYASLWEAWRKPWALSSGGPGSGLFKSTDGGRSWTELTRNPGLPPAEQVIGKIGVSVSPVDPSRVYAVIEADSGGVFVSDDGGRTWERTNNDRKLRQRAFYYTRIFADTEEKDVVYALNVDFWKSTDGGRTFDIEIEPPHGDNHDLWIAPSDNQRMVQGNDGGGNVSFNGGETWSKQNYPTSQMYRVSTTHGDPYFVCGGQQDNSTACVPSRGWEHLSEVGGVGDFFFQAGGCESGYVTNDPQNPSLFYAGCYGGSLTRVDRASGSERYVTVWPENPMGQSAEDLRERVQWTFPIVAPVNDPGVLYTTSQHVFRSTDQGHSWQRISPDLTRADPATMGPSGGPITKDQTGVETYPTVFAFDVAPQDPKVLWAASDDGLVHVSRDGGQNWQNVTPAELPEFTKVYTMEPSPHRLGTAYIAGNRFLLGDYEPYIFKTTDFGATWTRITDGIATGEWAYAIREDIVRPDLLYAGTEKGVLVSFDGGSEWHRLNRNLPVVQVPDIKVEDEDLVIATHGRSFWIMYDIAPLRQMTPAVAAEPVKLYQPGVTTRGVDPGVSVYYWLREPAEKVTLEFLDPQGNVINSFEGVPADTLKKDDGPAWARTPKPSFKAGLNRFTWNMRHQGFTDFPNLIMWAARNIGPVALPGRYQVRLMANGETETQPLEIRMDPRLADEVTMADLRERFDFAMRIRDRVTEANESVLLIRGVQDQVEDRLEATDVREIEEVGGQVHEKLEVVENEIYQTKNQSNQDPLNFPIKLNNKIAALMGLVEGSDARPTTQMYEVFDYLSAELQGEIGTMNAVLDEDLERLNRLLREHGLEPVERRPRQPEPDDVATD